MLRNIGAVIAGLVVGSIVNMSLVMLNSSVLNPMPPGTDMNDPAQFGAYIETLPGWAFLVVMAAHLGQATVGGWVAARLGASKPVVLALIVGVLTMLGCVANLLMLPGPAWMWIEVPLCLVAAWGVGTLEQRRREAAA